MELISAPHGMEDKDKAPVTAERFKALCKCAGIMSATELGKAIGEARQTASGYWNHPDRMSIGKLKEITEKLDEHRRQAGIGYEDFSLARICLFNDYNSFPPEDRRRDQNQFCNDVIDMTRECLDDEGLYMLAQTAYALMFTHARNDIDVKANIERAGYFASRHDLSQLKWEPGVRTPDPKRED